jgi:hypothetical protein
VERKIVESPCVTAMLLDDDVLATFSSNEEGPVAFVPVEAMEERLQLLPGTVGNNAATAEPLLTLLLAGNVASAENTHWRKISVVMDSFCSEESMQTGGALILSMASQAGLLLSTGFAARAGVPVAPLAFIASVIPPIIRPIRNCLSALKPPPKELQGKPTAPQQPLDVDRRNCS